MKERPIIMGSESIRAILDGTKSQTRRVIKPQPYKLMDQPVWVFPSKKSAYVQDSWFSETRMQEGLLKHCPFTVGQRLWVRETWRIMGLMYDEEPCFQYKADLAEKSCGVPDDWLDAKWEDWYERQSAKLVEDCERAGLESEAPYSDIAYRWERNACPTRWQPSIHMPKFAARIWLEVVSVRAERLQEITLNGIRAEGLDPAPYMESTWGEIIGCDEQAYRTAFARLWDSLHVKTGYTWDKNNWVWVVSFKVVP